jgi:hypothetical protein
MQKRAVHRLGPHEHCWAMAQNRTRVYLGAPARDVKSFTLKYFLRTLLSSCKSSSQPFSELIFITICAPLTL